MIIGILKEGMDLVNYVITLGWRCIRKEIKPSSSQFWKILENKYETEKQMHLNPIAWSVFVINGKPMKSYFKRAFSCKYV